MHVEVGGGSEAATHRTGRDVFAEEKAVNLGLANIARRGVAHDVHRGKYVESQGKPYAVHWQVLLAGAAVLSNSKARVLIR